MKIALQTLKFTESAELKNFVNEKVGKLFHKFPQILRVDVTLKVGQKITPQINGVNYMFHYPVKIDLQKEIPKVLRRVY